jgi:hypothetical protein
MIPPKIRQESCMRLKTCLEICEVFRNIPLIKCDPTVCLYVKGEVVPAYGGVDL